MFGGRHAAQEVIADGSQDWINTTLSFSGANTTALILKNSAPSPGATLTLNNSTVSGGRGIVEDDPSNIHPATLLNKGRLLASQSGTTISIEPGIFTNSTTGTVEASNGGTLSVVTTPTNYDAASESLTAGAWTADPNSTLMFPAAVMILNNAASLSLNGIDSDISGISSISENNGTIAISQSRNLTITPAGGAFTNNGTFQLGAGSILTLIGNGVQSSTGTLASSITGTLLADFGILDVAGSLILGGVVTPTIVSPYQPNSAASFQIVNAGSLNGAFDSIVPLTTDSGRQFSIVYGSTAATVVISSPSPSTPALLSGEDTGSSGGDGITKLTQLTFTGSASDAAKARLYVDGSAVGSGPIANGFYRLDALILSEGRHTVAVSAIDADGQESAQSKSLAVTIDVTPPAISQGYPQIDYPTGFTPPVQNITYRFNEKMSGIVSEEFSVINADTSSSVPITLSYITSTFTATLYWPTLNGGSGRLTDGNYISVSTGIPDIAGNPLAANSFSFFSLSGDANHDRTVNLLDLNALASNFGNGSATYSQGDFDYNGTVSIADFNLLAANFGTTLAAPGNSSPAAESLVNPEPTSLGTNSSLFSGVSIGPDLLGLLDPQSQVV